MTQNPVAFLSYVRSDDQHENGRLTQFRERLSGEVRMQTGEAFAIFQDRNDIAWGQQWKSRIEGTLKSVTFFIPIVTPSFFASPACRDELVRFLEHEATLKRTDLILPLYYVECSSLSDRDKRHADPLAQAIAERQFADWRELRFEPLTAPEVGKSIARMARQIVEALSRNHPEASKSKASEPSRGSATSRPERVDEEEVSVATTVEPSLNPSPKTQPPVLVVDALHRGDYPTLGEAVQAAKPGTRLLVRPGLYREGVVINKPLEIIGDGDRSEVVIEATGKNAILFRTDMGRIVNLTLRQVGGGNWYCVDVSQGRLDIEECDISSQSLACVAIRGGADPRVRRNRIHDGKSAGIHVYENGQGTLEDNEIFANANAGVSISSGGNPTLRRNRIHDGKAAGINVYENGQGTLEDNEIFANAYAGVEIKSGGNPTLRRNRVSGNKDVAVSVGEDSGGVFESNYLRENVNAAWRIHPSSAVKARRSDNVE